MLTGCRTEPEPSGGGVVMPCDLEGKLLVALFFVEFVVGSHATRQASRPA